MVVIRPYLSVKNALEALELYKKIFDIEVLSHVRVDKAGATTFGVPEGMDLSKTTMHSSFKIGDAPLYMSDNFTNEILEKTNVSILIEPESLEKMTEYFNNAEKNGCKINMKLEKQFWGDYFTSFTDQFGISWQMNYTPPSDD